MEQKIDKLGRITIPHEYRKRMNLHFGDKIKIFLIDSIDSDEVELTLSYTHEV